MFVLAHLPLPYALTPLEAKHKNFWSGLQLSTGNLCLITLSSLLFSDLKNGWFFPAATDCFVCRCYLEGALGSEHCQMRSSVWAPTEVWTLSATLLNAHTQAFAILLMCLRARSGQCSVSWLSVWKNANTKPRERWVHCSSTCLAGVSSSTALYGHFDPVLQIGQS